MGANQSKAKYEIPMMVTDETIREYGIPQEKVTWKMVGKRKCKAVMVPATKEEYQAYIQPVWAEMKRQDRERRCMVPGKDGRLIHCPETNRCDDCPHYSEVTLEANRPDSVEFLTENEAEPMMDSAFEDDAMISIILDDLIDMLAEVKPKYGRIFRLLYDGATQKEIAEALGMKERTVSDDIRDLRKIVQPIAKDIFDR